MNPETETNAAGRVKTRAQVKAGTEKPGVDEAVQDELNQTNPSIVDPAVLEVRHETRKLPDEERLNKMQQQWNNISRELIKLKADTDSKFKEVENKVVSLESKIETGMENLEEKMEGFKNKVWKKWNK